MEAVKQSHSAKCSFISPPTAPPHFQDFTIKSLFFDKFIYRKPTIENLKVKKILDKNLLLQKIPILFIFTVNFFQNNA